ncbi:replicase [Goji berry chlorosis virus]|nr:replicase [Goji berry chlorosis virus]
METPGNCYRLLARGFPGVYQDYFVSITPQTGPISNLLVARFLVDAAWKSGVDPFLVCFPLIRYVGGNLYHVDITKVCTLFHNLRVLFEDPCGFCGMDPQGMIEQSASVNASVIATNEVSRLFRSNLESMISVRVKLDRREKQMVESYVGPYVRFLQEKVCSNDHRVLVALREVTRTIYSRCATPKTTALKTLCLGVSDREVREYWDNENVHFYYHGSEGKDTTRFAVEVMKNILKSKAKKKIGKDSVRLKVRRVEDLIHTAEATGAVPDRFDQNFSGVYQQILAEDVGYNWTEKDWIDMFRKTNATVCWGYMCLPWELLFDTTLPSDLYKYCEWRDGLTTHASMTFSYSNGYTHPKNAWGTLLTKNVLRCEDFSLVPEIISRNGPMTVFCIRRVLGKSNEPIVRTMEIPDTLKCVEVLDVLACVNKSGKINKKLIYNLVRKNEFEEIYNYILSLDEKSVKLQNVITYIRRRTKGVSLVNAELVSPWCLDDSKIYTIAVTMLLFVQQQMTLSSNVFKNLGVGERRERWISALRVFFSEGPISKLVDFLLAGHLDSKLVKNVDDKVFQVTKLKQWKFSTMDYTLERDCDGTSTELTLDETCEVCAFIKPSIGDQDLRCISGDKTHRFGLDNAELGRFSEELGNTLNDSVGLKTVKEKARENLPRSGFMTDEVKIVYVKGGPGSGKSRLIRNMTDDTDLIVAPFSKLRTDYGGRNFMTQHKALSAVGYRRIFVDEFTALPYEFLACIVHNCAAEIVYLVGDLSQTGIIEGVEGISICSKISFDNVAKHELAKNYRNPADTVALLNHFYGYDMVPVSKNFGMRFRHLDMWSPSDKLTPLCFTRNSAVSLGLQTESVIEKMTVRANQGTTHDAVGLFVTAHDSNLTNVDCLNVVALSRHRDRCIIFNDDGESSLSAVLRIKTFWDSFVDQTVPVPVKNLCLLEALCELLSSYTRTGFTVEDLWRNLVCVVGVDEARTIRNSMLTEKHLDLLVCDLGVSVGLLRGTKGIVTYGVGNYIGQIKYTRNHFVAQSRVDRLWYGLAMDQLNIPGEGVSWVDHSEADSTLTTCCCGGKLMHEVKTFSKEMTVLTPRPLNRDFSVGVYCDGDGVGVNIFGDDVYGLSYPTNVREMLQTMHVGLKNSIVIALRFLSGGRIVRFADLGVYGECSLVALGGDFCFDLENVGKKGKSLSLSIGDVLKLDDVSGHEIDVKNPDMSAVLVVVGKRKPLPVCGGAADVFLDVRHDDIPEFSAKFDDLIQEFDISEPGFPVSVDTDLVLPDEIKPLEQTPSDAFLLIKQHFDINPGAPAQFTNEEASRFIGGSFSKGTLHTTILDQINMRGHPTDNRVKFFAVTPNGPGLYYFQKSQWQELQCLQGRYLGKTLAADFDINGERIAREIADLFVDEHMNLNNSFVHQDEIDNTVLASMRSMRTKNYEKQVSLENLGIGCNVVRFHMKDIFKPFKDKVDTYKVGQGISAWSKEAQSLFQTGCRIINLVFARMLNNNVVYDNLIPEVDLLNKVNCLLGALPDVCCNGVIDATACDSGQNAFTQAIERRILVRMGVCPIFIEWYYRFRRTYLLTSHTATAKVDWIKTSGEPATLLCNTILMMALMNALLRGEGPCVLLGKGDDGLKRQANLTYNRSLVEKFSKYTKLQFKVDIDKPVNFCGYSLVGAKLFPCIMRKAQKIAGHKFRDYEHFCEYQQSLRDWVLLCNKIGYSQTVLSTAMFTGIPHDLVWNMLYAVQSVSHINREQFHILFKEYSVDLDEFVPITSFVPKNLLNFQCFSG